MNVNDLEKQNFLRDNFKEIVEADYSMATIGTHKFTLPVSTSLLIGMGIMIVLAALLATGALGAIMLPAPL